MVILLQPNTLPLAESAIPDLNNELYKGQCGRIGIMGGCWQYTGAPYFAAISSLKSGSDLVFVFCTTAAANPIKSYSPELIVIPIIDTPEAESTFPQYLKSLHALVIGPGLGKAESLRRVVFLAIQTMKEQNKPLILDADSLHFLAQDINIIKGYPKALLTPNAIEFSRLYKVLFSRDLSKEEMAAPKDRVFDFCKLIDNVTIVVKGQEDVISDGKCLTTCTERGSGRRCGGQGDLLAGFMANFAHWTTTAKARSKSEISESRINPCIIAAYAACFLTRKCNGIAFERFGRSTTSSDLIKAITPAFASVFSSKFKA